MSRALILPTPANPFLLCYWIHLYKQFIKPEIDTLYVHVNQSLDENVKRYIDDLLNEDGIIYVYTDHQIEHGDAIDKILDLVTEKYVCLIEDDCLIFKSGAINQYFTELEQYNYEVVGSKRGSCGKEIWDASQDKYDLDYTGYGDTGCNFWPNLFFIETEALRQTDRNFKAKEWKAGTFIPELNYTIQQDTYGDTFVNTSIQILNKYPQHRILYIPQYHASPDDGIHYDQKTSVFDGNARYIHVGSLSSMNVNTYTKQQYLRNEYEKKEWERRVAFWRMFYQFSYPFPTYMNDYANKYNEVLERMTADLELSAERICIFQSRYKKLGL
jgi:hypothetical protein